MATRDVPYVPLGEGDAAPDAATQRQWQRPLRLSSFADVAERLLEDAAHERGAWLVVAFAAGIAAWFGLAGREQWLAFSGLVTFGGAIAWLHWRDRDERTLLRIAAVALAVALVFGMATVWARSELVGTPPLARPYIGSIEGRILDREEQPSLGRVRLILAIREPGSDRAVKVRLNVPSDQDRMEMVEGTRVRTGARLLPPAPPLLPGAYDFARRAWFEGLAATGSPYGPMVVLEQGESRGTIARTQRELSRHVRMQTNGSAGAIAAAFASGDRGAIAEADAQAMRDAGLTHLLSISGMHVSAVIAAAFFVAIKLLALWPWLALRVRVPVLAAVFGAVAGVGYTVLTGAEVPTVRSCLGAGLVLLALALGREPLSLRMVAIAAGIVLLVWPESLVGPSFQMSFAAVLAIVALHGSGPVKAFLAARDEVWWARMGRRVLMLFLTGLVIEAALTPIVLFHFHRSGIYGAFANVLAIPLVTLVSMPLIALALFLDLAGLGAPIWWLVGRSLEALLALAHFVADRPGAVRLMPQIGIGVLLVYVGGMLWLALWCGRVRLLGLVPVAVAVVLMLMSPVPDILIARDGRQMAVTDPDGQLLVLREGEGYVIDSLREAAAVGTQPVPIETAPDARCSADFCRLVIRRGGREWTVLVARSKRYVDVNQLVEACADADIVVAARSMPWSCQPRWIKADRRFLAEYGGLSLFLGTNPHVRTVADGQGQHGWWHSGEATRQLPRTPPDR